MTKTSEIVVTALIFTAMYCALPLRNSKAPNGTQTLSSGGADQLVIIADGTDPMPIKR
jgi:hypothetical protein